MYRCGQVAFGLRRLLGYRNDKFDLLRFWVYIWIERHEIKRNN